MVKAHALGFAEVAALITARPDIPGLLPDCDLHMPTIRQAGKTEWTHLLQVLAGLRRGAGSQLLHRHCWPGTLLS